MKITIEADFSPWELAQVIQKVRDLDHPERAIRMGADAPEFSMAQMQAVFAFLDPPMENIGFFRKYDEEMNHG